MDRRDLLHCFDDKVCVKGDLPIFHDHCPIDFRQVVVLAVLEGTRCPYVEALRQSRDKHQAHVLALPLFISLPLYTGLVCASGCLVRRVPNSDLRENERTIFRLPFALLRTPQPSPAREQGGKNGHRSNYGRGGKRIS